MGIDLYIGEEQLRLSNAFWYNEFMNWVADQTTPSRDFPLLLGKSPTEDKYTQDEVQMLKVELAELLKKSPPDYAEHIIVEMLTACKVATERGSEVTFYYEGGDAGS